MSSSGDNGETRPSREIAYRLFAAEFDDASFSYSESDEERAPNYVVTPTGARVNRLFAVGVLTEVEPVNDDVLRGRLVDPTGAFVSYAGQYQPDEMAFLDRASPPAFVALSGKARTFQPDDSDRVFTSVRPESMSRVDADTRDRWTVSTAEATLSRVGVMAAALESGLEGRALSDALLDAGVDEALSTGIPLALDHYGTTPAYLSALRRLALDALEVVANDRDSVRSLALAPGDVGEGDETLAALAADLDLSVAEAADATTPTDEAVGADPTSDEGAETTPADVEAEIESTATASTTESTTQPTDTAGESTASTTEPASDVSETEDVPVFDDQTAPDASETTEEPVTPETTAAVSDTTPEETPVEPTSSESVSAGTSDSVETSGSVEAVENVTENVETTAPTDDELGDFDVDDSDIPGDSLGDSEPDTASVDDELGDFDAGDSEPTNESAESDRPDDPAVTAGTDSDGMYELADEEREEIEAEFGTEFSTGSEVAPAGEADIDVPSVEELEEELDEDLGSSEGTTAETVDATANAADAATEATDAATEATDAATEATDAATEATDAATAADPDAAETETERATETTDDAAEAEDSAAAVDLETVAVEAMDALDEGTGASREAVVAYVVDEYGADPEAIEDAIQSALMSGQCYEPTEDSLKAI